jgi:hypothetical protein
MKKIILLTCLIVFVSTILTGCQTLNSENSDKYILSNMLPKELDMPLTKESLSRDETKKIIEKYLNLLKSKTLMSILKTMTLGILMGMA